MSSVASGQIGTDTCETLSRALLSLESVYYTDPSYPLTLTNIYSVATTSIYRTSAYVFLFHLISNPFLHVIGLGPKSRALIGEN